MNYTRHIFWIPAITLLILACTFLPFFPGRYDNLATTLSGMAQIFGVVGLLLVPVGALWLVFGRRAGKTYPFVLAAGIALSIVALIVTLGALIHSGFAFGIIAFALFAFAISRFIRRLASLKDAETVALNPVPLYLLVVPVVVALVQFAFITPASKFSRDRAIQNSARLIQDIEEYRKTYGRYPLSLLAMNRDYHPGIIGIERYYYEPHGDAYNLFFEQPASILQPGTQEVVMYNPRDEHVSIGHDGDILRWTPEQLATRRGWYAVHDTAIPHWKYFWFD